MIRKANTSIKKNHMGVKNFFSYLFFVYFIFSTDSFYASTNINTTFFVISKYIIVFLGCIGFIKTLYSKYIWLNCLFCFSLISIIFMGGYSDGVIFKFLLMFAGLCFVEMYGWKDFREKYIKIMTFVSVYSLICFLFAPVLVNCNFFPIVQNVNHVLYRDFFFTHFSLLPDYQSVLNVWRNYGPFWEPGVYQIYLLFGVILVLFDENKISKFHLFVFSVTLFTTFSTAGFITFGVVLIAFFFKRGYIKEKIYIICIVVFLLVFLLSNEIFVAMVFDKLLNMNESSSSRIESLLGGMYISFTNPLGTGPYLFLEKMKEYGYSGTEGNTNGFIQHFGIMGWAFGIWYVYRLFGFVKCIEKKNIFVKFILFLAIVMELCNEPLFYSLPFSAILFYKPKEGHRLIEEKKLYNW